MAAEYINGVQSKGVVAAIKHFVCNDQEHERHAVNCIVTERALREIYLKPFQIAVRNSSPGSIMTAYNKVNGTHASENIKLLQDIVREEWAWNGLIMSDWYGTYSTSEAVIAGLDLEMPGPSRWRSGVLLHALSSRKLSQDAIDKAARHVLEFVKRASKLKLSSVEKELDRQEDRQLNRKLAAESIVLLKNDNSVLPLKNLNSLAIIGPNAKTAAYCGGGSASLRAYYTVTPYEALVESLPDVEIHYAVGAYTNKSLPNLGQILRNESGKLGVMIKFYNDPVSETGRRAIHSMCLSDTNIQLMDYKNSKLNSLYYASVEGSFTPDEDGIWEFGVSVYGLAQLYVDNSVVVDNETQQRPGDFLFGNGTIEERGKFYLKKGQSYAVRVEFTSAPACKLSRKGSVSFGGGGLKFGGQLTIDPHQALQDAVELASKVDAVVVFAGLNVKSLHPV